MVLGSRRVTRDFDFVISHPGDRLARTIGLFYDRGCELVSRQELLRLKRIAKAARSAPGDAEDIAFRQARRKHST